MKLPLAGASYTTRSLAMAAQQSMNCYAEAIEDPNGSGKGDRYLRKAPGYKLLVNLTTVKVGGKLRGVWSGGGRCFVVLDEYLVEIDNSGAVVSSHAMPFFDSTPAQMFGNGNQLGIVNAGYFFIDNGAGPVQARFLLNGTFTTADGTHLVWASGDLFDGAMAGVTGYFNGSPISVSSYTDTTHVTLGSSVGIQTNPVPFSIAAGDYVTAVTGAYLDGSFYVQRPSGGSPDLGRQVNFSAINDGTSWSGLDFFTKEGYPDYINAIFADREQLYVLGTESSEVWQNDPSTGRPTRLQGAMAREGLACRYSVVSMQEHVYFIGGTPGGGAAAFRLDGFTLTRISTHAVEEAWATNSEFVSTAVSYWYEEDGHFFWVICFPGSASAWVYDATEKFWHERAQWNGSAFQRESRCYHTYIPEWSIISPDLNGLHIVCDSNSAKVYTMSSSYTDDDGSNMKLVRALPYIYGGLGKRVFVDRLDIAVDTGETASTEPNVSLEWSSDNGHTWSTVQTTGFGATGEYAKRVFWIAQGSFDVGAIPRISYTGKEAFTAIDCEAEVYIGMS